MFRADNADDEVSVTELERWQTEFDPDAHDVIRVYRPDQTYKYVVITKQTTAREVSQEKKGKKKK